MKIGLCQTNTGRDESKTLSDLRISLPSLKTADLIVTPECTNLMGYNPQIDHLQTEENDPTLNFLQEWARGNNVHVLVGSLLLSDPEKGNVNRQILIDGKGEIVARYDKIHMFDITLPNGETYRESERFHAGDRAIVSQVAGVEIGHSICFDIRFPKLYRALAGLGAKVVVVPAAFTQVTGRAHWEILLRARAIENGVFMIAPAQTGSYLHQDGTTRYCFGNSMVIAPWGEVLANLGDLPSTKLVEIDLSRVEKAQSAIPAFQMEREFKI